VTVSATVLGVRKTKSVTFMLFKPQVDQFDIIAQATHVTTEYGTSNSPSLTNYHGCRSRPACLITRET